jgi:hypothetical protein
MPPYSTILETYSLSEILELNDLTEEDLLEFLVEEGMIKLPDIKPLDFE